MITNPKPYDYKGFNVRDNDYGVALLLSHNRIKESRHFMLENDIKGIEINYMFDNNITDLNYLKDFNFIKHIRIVNESADLKGLYYLSNLKSLELGVENDQEFDFTNFPYLESCYFSWKKNRGSIFKCTDIKRLGIEKYNAKNLEDFKPLRNLEYLGIGNSSISTLKGIESLSLLRELDLSYLNKIETLEGVQKLMKLEKVMLYGLNRLISLDELKELSSIREISMDKCKNVNDLDFARKLINLKKLTINNLGTVKSIGPIENLINLYQLFFIENTNIEDGNLNPIVELKKKKLKRFSFMNRRHYSHKREELGWPECLR